MEQVACTFGLLKILSGITFREFQENIFGLRVVTTVCLRQQERARPDGFALSVGQGC